MRGTRTSRNARAYIDDEEQLQEAFSRSLISLSAQTPSGPVFTEEDDDEGIEEERTELFAQRLMQQGQWRVKYLDEAWQLAKKCLFLAEEIPKKLKKHPSLHSYIVQSNVVPKKITRIIADGSCMFRAISFCLFRDQEYHRLVRRDILTHTVSIWDETPRVRLLASMWYQDKTRKQRHLRPSRVVLSADEYIQSVRMDVPTTWGGSTELEVAARWLRTPIKVYFSGNPKFPPKSWITYGDCPNLHNT